jgi:hypothetical protein
MVHIFYCLQDIFCRTLTGCYDTHLLLLAGHILQDIDRLLWYTSFTACRTYFGNGIALHLSFLNAVTVWLIPAAAMSTLLTLTAVREQQQQQQDGDHVASAGEHQ